MTAAHQALWRLLNDLQGSMKKAGLWQEQRPSDEALLSAEPFCVDTLTFEQWVQFIMMPSFESLIQNQLALPHQCHIAPMAEEAWKDSQLVEVIAHLRAIDQLINGASD